MSIVKAIAKATLAADAISLGVHWIYEPKIVAQRFVAMEDGLTAPFSDSYHVTAKKGDFTHYGDQCLLLLKTLAQDKTFNAQHFATNWYDYFKNYSGYFDKASKDTMQNLVNGKNILEAGSSSLDLGGVSRGLPLFLVYKGDLKTMLEWAPLQASLTHNSTCSLQAASFFAEFIQRLIEGQEIKDVLKDLIENIADPSIKANSKKALQSTSIDSVTVIGEFGRTCSGLHLLPGIVHLLAKYHDEPENALKFSLLGGGDNATRASLVAGVMAAKHGDFINSHCWNEVNKKDEIEELLKSF